MKRLTSFDNTEIAFRNRSDKDLQRAYLLFTIMNNKAFVELGKLLLRISLFLHLPVKSLIKSTIFSQFCGGESMDESNKTTEALALYRIKTILDYSVEGKEGEVEFEKACDVLVNTVRNAASHSQIPFAVFKMTGIAGLSLLERVSKGGDLSPYDKEAYKKVAGRVERICRAGYEMKIPVLIDAEESWIQDAIDALAFSMMEKFNREKAIVFNTIQFYRKGRTEFLARSIEKAKSLNLKYGLKLVRGAYMEKERERSGKLGYEDPINRTKADTDADFNKALRICLENIAYVSICSGTHNEESCLLLADLMEEFSIPRDDERVYFAQLLGMGDHISFNLSEAGYNVAKYVPFGPVYDVTPYLMRRTEENTSIAGQTSRELTLIRKEMLRRKAT